MELKTLSLVIEASIIALVIGNFLLVRPSGWFRRSGKNAMLDGLMWVGVVALILLDTIYVRRAYDVTDVLMAAGSLGCAVQSGLLAFRKPITTNMS